MAKANVVKAEETNKQVAVAGEAVPDFMKGDVGKGAENITQDDIGLPRYSLLHATSDQVAAGLGKPGDYYHLLADQNMGDKITITPIMTSTGYMLWRPRDSGGGLLARSDDGIHWSPRDAEFDVKLDNNGPMVKWKLKPTVKESGLADWGSENPNDPTSPPAATKMINVLCWVHEYPELSPVVFTFQRSSLSVSKKFLGRLKLSKSPIFGLKFILGSESIKNKAGKNYLRPTITGAGFVDEALYNGTLKGMYETFAKSGIRVREEGLEGEGKDGDSTPEDTADTGNERY